MGIFKKKADVKINAYGYEKGDGLASTVEIEGSARDIVTLCDGIVKGCAQSVEKADGLAGACAFAEVVLNVLEEVNPMAYRLAKKHKETKNNKKDTEPELALDKIFLDLMKKKLGEESGEADA